MKIKASALLLASALVGTHALDGMTTVITGDQNAKETICKGMVKDLLTCALKEEWQNDAWVPDPVCLPKYVSIFEECEGASLVYEDGHYAAATTLSKTLQLQGLVAIPAHDNKLRGVSCAICSKFTKKLLECALPVTPSGGTTDDALFDAMEACLTTPWDGVLAHLCLETGRGSPLEVDSTGKLSYVLMSPVLAVGGISEGCATVEARARLNGVVMSRVHKGHLQPYSPSG